MRAVFREDHNLFREQVRRFVDREVAPRYLKWEKDGIVSRDVWIRAGANGLLCPSIPNEYGGGGGDFGHSAAMIEELARVGAGGIGFPLHSDIVAPYILKYGNEEQKQRWLPKMASGEMIGAIAMTEPGAGSDLKAIRTTALRDNDVYILNGQKTFISNGINADLIIVVCKTDTSLGAKGVSLVVVERGTAGFSRGRNLEKIGLHAQDTAELFFTDTRVPTTNLLGDENNGFIYLMQQMPQERFLNAVRSVASVEFALEQTIAYAKARRAFNRAIFDHQVNKFRLADAKAKVVMLRTFIDTCLDKHLKVGLSLSDAAIAKLNASRLQNQLLDVFLQMHGGYGYMSEYFIGRAWADARVSRIYGGSDEIMQEIISRSL